MRRERRDFNAKIATHTVRDYGNAYSKKKTFMDHTLEKTRLCRIQVEEKRCVRMT